MKKRKLVVESAEKALKLMLSMLSANMVDNELINCDASEKGVEHNGVKYPIKLVWLERGDNDFVGCPCFTCRFNGVLPTGDRVEADVYVKTFAVRALTMCKMNLHHKGNTMQREIEDGQTFVMDDHSKGYGEEKYIYKDNKSIPL